MTIGIAASSAVIRWRNDVGLLRQSSGYAANFRKRQIEKLKGPNDLMLVENRGKESKGTKLRSKPVQLANNRAKEFRRLVSR